MFEIPKFRYNYDKFVIRNFLFLPKTATEIARNVLKMQHPH